MASDYAHEVNGLIQTVGSYLKANDSDDCFLLEDLYYS
jgi:hypothetical protein